MQTSETGFSGASQIQSLIVTTHVHSTNAQSSECRYRDAYKGFFSRIWFLFVRLFVTQTSAQVCLSWPLCGSIPADCGFGPWIGHPENIFRDWIETRKWLDDNGFLTRRFLLTGAGKMAMHANKLGNSYAVFILWKHFAGLKQDITAFGYGSRWTPRSLLTYLPICCLNFYLFVARAGWRWWVNIRASV